MCALVMYITRHMLFFSDHAQQTINFPSVALDVASVALDVVAEETVAKIKSPSIRKRRYPTSKPFKCDKCNQGFNQRIHLKKHQQSKHSGKYE